MERVANLEPMVFVLSLAILWLEENIGTSLRRHNRFLSEDEVKDFDVVLTATMTLLGLIIGFSFSMVIHGFDQRKNDEFDEANGIGTEYVRADLLQSADVARLWPLLKEFIDERVLFYEATDCRALNSIDAQTARL